jgi:pimeloyl-ACP methyl ester carboxylesterase
VTQPLAARVVATGAGPVEVATAGDAGPAVLVVHGTPGDWRQARALAADLRDTHRVVLPSRPGYGRTPLRVGRTPEQQAAAHVALLDALGLDRAAVVGISGGGPSSYAFAARHPDRCTGLVLCCAVAAHLMTPPRSMRLLAAVPGVWAGLSALARPRLRSRLADEAAVLAELSRGLSELERASLATDPRMRADLLAFAADRVEALRGTGLRNDTRAFARAARRGGSAAWGSAAPSVHVLHGDADDVVPLAHAVHHVESIPGAVLEVLPGYAHALPLTARDRLAAIVRSLAVSVPAPPAPAAG